MLHPPPLDMDTLKDFIQDKTESKTPEHVCCGILQAGHADGESVYPGSVRLQAAGGGAGVFIHVYMFTTLSGQRQYNADQHLAVSRLRQ